MKATWNGHTIAESNNTIVVENNHYFPLSDVHQEFLNTSDLHSTCPWKGEASYYDVTIDGKILKDAAWYYPEAKTAAKNIEGYLAFWKGVKVE